MGLEKNRFKVSAKPFNIGMIIVGLFLYPFEPPLLETEMIKRILAPPSGGKFEPRPF
jgi:hypothetical protein